MVSKAQLKHHPLDSSSLKWCQPVVLNTASLRCFASRLLSLMRPSRLLQRSANLRASARHRKLGAKQIFTYPLFKTHSEKNSSLFSFKFFWPCLFIFRSMGLSGLFSFSGDPKSVVFTECPPRVFEASMAPVLQRLVPALPAVQGLDEAVTVTELQLLRRVGGWVGGWGG